ncbi:metal ABC transporter permease [bacterium]|nr:metal ABC transporter permease [bacterium]
MSFFADLARYDFLRIAVLTALLASVACGIVGTYVVTRRITYLAGAISHSILGGMGLFVYLAKVHGLDFLQPLHGALVAALGSALLAGWVTLRMREREDMVIGAIWAVGMAVGVLFISRTPGFAEDLMNYLFGNILMVSRHDVALIAMLDALIVAVCLVFYDQFLVVCFDPLHARVRGLADETFHLMLLTLTALTVVLLVSVVGIVLVIALLTLPIAIASVWSRTIGGMMISSILVCAALTVGGLAASYETNLPAGATIIVVAAASYLAVFAVSRIVAKRRKALKGEAVSG